MQVDIHEAAAQLEQLVARLTLGERITLVRDGLPLADLVRPKQRALAAGVGSADMGVLPPEGEPWFQPSDDDAQVEEWLHHR